MTTSKEAKQDSGYRKKLRYQLSYQEAYDAFRLLALRQSRRTRIILGVCLTAAAVGLLIYFALDPLRIFALLLALIAILLLFYLIYHPALSARRGAAKVAKQHGTYEVTVCGSGQIDLAGGTSLQYGEDKFARTIETDTIFAVRADQYTTICIPKRLLTNPDIEKIRTILKAKKAY